MKKYLFALSTAMLLTGCCSFPHFENCDPADYPIHAMRTEENITLDGKLDEGAWAKVKSSPLYYTPSVIYPELPYKQINASPFESAQIKILYDDKYVYIGAVCEDHDIMQYDTKNQTMSFNSGDTLEIFLKAENHPAYWEIYVTPQNTRTSFYFIGRGARITAAFDKENFIKEMRSGVQLNGTLNKHTDKDSSWSAELAIPRSALEKNGIKFEPGNEWKLLLARYNYGIHQSYFHISTYPKTPVANNHLIEYYGKVIFE